MSEVLNTLLLSLVAGMGTSIGGLLAVVRKPGKRQFGFLMGMTAGVMVFITLDELVPTAREY
jgi:ZIP family zinc transporter